MVFVTAWNSIFSVSLSLSLLCFRLREGKDEVIYTETDCISGLPMFRGDLVVKTTYRVTPSESDPDNSVVVKVRVRLGCAKRAWAVFSSLHVARASLYLFLVVLYLFFGRALFVRSWWSCASASSDKGKEVFSETSANILRNMSRHDCRAKHALQKQRNAWRNTPRTRRD